MKNIIEDVCNNEIKFVLEYLIKGGDVHFTEDQEGITALHHAVANNHYLIGLLLLNFGADSMIEDAEGWSPYLLALFQRDRHWLQMLLYFHFLKQYC